MHACASPDPAPVAGAAFKIPYRSYCEPNDGVCGSGYGAKGNPTNRTTELLAAVGCVSGSCAHFDYWADGSSTWDLVNGATLMSSGWCRSWLDEPGIRLGGLGMRLPSGRFRVGTLVGSPHLGPPDHVDAFGEDLAGGALLRERVLLGQDLGELTEEVADNDGEGLGHPGFVGLSSSWRKPSGSVPCSQTWRMRAAMSAQALTLTSLAMVSGPGSPRAGSAPSVSARRAS